MRINSIPPLNLSFGEGLGLWLADQVPPAALGQILYLTEGRLVWRSAEQRVTLEAPNVWLLGSGSRGILEGAGDQPFQLFSVLLSACPDPGLDPFFSRLADLDKPRAQPSLVGETRELRDIAVTCRTPCELRSLLARGKALMVVSKALQSLEQPEPSDTYGVRFFRDDLDRIRQARALLVHRMTAPPTLGALAREVGVNELKLKAGFRRLWGTTVFEVLRQERLAEARRLLDTGECNVSTAAFRVGYTNTSHFAKSFQQRFGVSPGTLARSAGV